MSCPFCIPISCPLYDVPGLSQCLTNNIRWTRTSVKLIQFLPVLQWRPLHVKPASFSACRLPLKESWQMVFITVECSGRWRFFCRPFSLVKTIAGPFILCDCSLTSCMLINVSKVFERNNIGILFWNLTVFSFWI